MGCRDVFLVCALCRLGMTPANAFVTCPTFRYVSHLGLFDKTRTSRPHQAPADAALGPMRFSGYVGVGVYALLGHHPSRPEAGESPPYFQRFERGGESNRLRTRQDPWRERPRGAVVPRHTGELLIAFQVTETTCPSSIRSARAPSPLCFASGGSGSFS